jgi:hypothetical protein
MSVLTFVIVGTGDAPIYEADFTGPKEPSAANLHQFVLHASLDAVDQAAAASREPFLKNIDRFNALAVSAFLCPGGARLLLLHDGGRGEEPVRAFFAEVQELHLRTLLNPFYSPSSRIASRDFDRRVRAAAKKAFG